PRSLWPRAPAGAGCPSGRVRMPARWRSDPSRSTGSTRCRRVGALPTLHELAEGGEQVAGVVGTGSGLRVVLHAERRHIAAADALDDAVVEIHVSDVGPRHRSFDHG